MLGHPDAAVAERFDVRASRRASSSASRRVPPCADAAELEDGDGNRHGPWGQHSPGPAPDRPRTPRGAARRRRATAASARRGRAAARAVGRRPSPSAIARSRPTSAAGKASGSRISRMAMYCAVHSPMPGRARSVRMASSRLRRGPKMSASSRTVRGQRAEGRGPRPGMPRPTRSRSARRPASGKTWVSPSRPAAGVRHGLAERGDEAPGQPHRAGDGDLLAEHGAHGELEAVPGAGDAQPGPGRDQRRERPDPRPDARRSARDRPPGRTPAAGAR